MSGTARGNLEGALWMVASGVVFTAQNAVVKELGTRLDSFEIAFFRCLFGFLAVLPFLARGGTSMFMTGRPALHVARALVGVSTMFCGMYAYTHLPLADATAIGFARPLFTVLLAAALLGEIVGWRRLSATAVGFAGVLIIVRPGSEIFDFAHVAALAGAFLGADVVVLVKKLQGSERNATIMAYFGIVTTIASAVPAALVWQTPTAGEFALLVTIGCTASTAQWMTLKAYRAADASTVVPFDYSRLIFAIFYGWLFFAEIPDRWTLLGSAILVAATLYIAYREIALGRSGADGPGTGPDAGRAP
ncbi:MAG: DMT family transporter [Rhodospirillales bacterium]|nr:DMT family transporter [Rhodospirillales bacterium]